MHPANLENGMRDTEFRVKKERILILHYLLDNVSSLDRDQIRTLADDVLNPLEKQAVLELFNVTRKVYRGTNHGVYSGSDLSRAFGKGTLGIGSKSSNLTMGATLWRDANNYALSVSDSRFLLDLGTAPFDACLHGATADTQETANVYLCEFIESLVDEIGKRIFKIQNEECDQQIQREIRSEEEKELGTLRSEFVHRVQDLSRERTRSNGITQCGPRSVHVDNFTAKIGRSLGQ
jgi:hypothetical protein